MRCLLACVVTAFFLAADGRAQNLLVNGSFDEPAGEACRQQDGVTVPGWNGLTRINGDLYVPTCPRDGDGSHASVQGWGAPSPPVRFYQTVKGVNPGTPYAFEGLLWIGCMDANGSTTARAEIRDGPGLDFPLVAFAEQVKRGAGDTGQWLAFSAVGEPEGSQVTVVIVISHVGGTGWAVHCDACVLSEAGCVAQPAVAGIEPPWGVYGQPAEVTILGDNFTPGAMTAVLTRVGSLNIAATDLDVAGDGRSMTGTFDLTGAAAGRWNLVVRTEDPACSEAVLPTAFVVVFEELVNGSFEDPDPGNAGCAESIANGAPSGWQVSEVVEYGWDRALSRDELDIAPPACPPPDGGHYASSWSDAQGGTGAEARIYQTIVVQPGVQYTVGAQFAGAGQNTVILELLDGDESAWAFASTPVRSGFEAYDWTPASVTGVPLTELMTIQWRIVLDGMGPHSSHADAFALAADNAAPTLSVDPEQANLMLCGGEARLELTATAEDADGDPLAYQWSAGAGVELIPGDPPSRATAVFTELGGYTITCTVSDGFNVVRADIPVVVGECRDVVYILTGDANCDNLCNIADAICILAYLFGQPEDACKRQCCAASEDTNHDGKIDISDAVKLLGYLFSGGSMVDAAGNPVTSTTNACKPYAPEKLAFPCQKQCRP